MILRVQGLRGQIRGYLHAGRRRRRPMDRRERGKRHARVECFTKFLAHGWHHHGIPRTQIAQERIRRRAAPALWLTDEIILVDELAACPFCRRIGHVTACRNLRQTQKHREIPVDLVGTVHQIMPECLGFGGKRPHHLLSVEIRDFRDPAAELPHACSQQDAAHACCERRVSCTRYTCCCFMKILLFEKNDKKHYCDNCRNESARKKARHPRIRHDTLRAAAKGRRILALHEKHQARRNAVHLAIREAMGILRYCLS